MALACGNALAAEFLVDGRLLIVKDTKLLKVVAKDAAGGMMPVPAVDGPADPLINGGSFQAFDTLSTGVLTDQLTNGVWTGLGSPPGSRGYKYKNTAAPVGGAVKSVLITKTLIRIIAKDDGTLNGPVPGTVRILLSMGDDYYCAEFGGTTLANMEGIVKRKDAPAPAASCLDIPARGATTMAPR